VDLKAEAIGLAVSLELPMVIVDVQRAGPSTGMPTKTEQTDLLLAMFGRHGESPLPIVAAASPSDCFDAAFESVRLAVKYRTPVILLTDGYLANGAEPWLLPDVDALPDISVPFATEPNHDDGLWPYLRDPETLARPWAVPGTPGLQHRIGGIEKEDGSGNISYQPENHDRMVRIRQAKVDGIARDIPGVELDDEDGAQLVVLGWGSTWGAIKAGVRRVRAGGGKIAHCHLRHLNPLPADLGEVLGRYDKVLCPELNLGQLAMLVRAKYLIDVRSFTKVQGVPFRAAEMEARMWEEIRRD
jgi:2-oxoglutarate ferredoxin oxidoreductase subunit alpha